MRVSISKWCGKQPHKNNNNEERKQEENKKKERRNTEEGGERGNKQIYTQKKGKKMNYLDASMTKETKSSFGVRDEELSGEGGNGGRRRVTGEDKGVGTYGGMSPTTVEEGT